MQRNIAIVAALLIALLAGSQAVANGGNYVMKPAPMGYTRLDPGFWEERRELVRSATMPHEWEQMEAHHHLHNFRVTAGESQGMHMGAVFLDSDLYKWLEAASYLSGIYHQDDWMADRVEELAGLIEKSQMDDGYINTYYQNIAPDRRWTNLWMNHELYCAGHLMEAACARHQYSGDDRLLDVAIRFADHIDRTFGPDKNTGMPGHQEIEIALMRLYRATGDDKYMELCRHLVMDRAEAWSVTDLLADVRDQASLSRIADDKRMPFIERKDDEATTSYGFAKLPLGAVPRSISNFYTGKYFQAHKPVNEQLVAVGHAVRANYYYAGAADLYLETGGRELIDALSKNWHNTIDKRTYLTGGQGAIPIIEGYGKDYELPHRSYTETCAAISSFFFSWRMLEATGEAVYAGQMERALYNAILGGLSLDGKKFFYRNPLEARGDLEREPWYVVACCPPNIARVIASIDRYIYGASEDTAWINQYITGGAIFRADGGEVSVVVESGFPWKGGVMIGTGTGVSRKMTMKLRQPSWSDSLMIEVNGKPLEYEVEPGTYLTLTREWNNNDTVELIFDMSPRFVFGRKEVTANRGKAAIMRGPLVYCFEDVDNEGLNVHSMKIDTTVPLTDEWEPDLLGGVYTVSAKTASGKTAKAVPFFCWANRGPSHMEVWVDANK